MSDITTVTIPKKLADKIKERLKDTSFTNLSSFMVYLARVYLSETSDKGINKNPLSKDDEKKIKIKLRKLGYID